MLVCFDDDDDDDDEDELYSANACFDLWKIKPSLWTNLLVTNKRYL